MEREPEVLWDYIRYLRKRNNMKIPDFARAVGCSAYHARAIEMPFDASVRRSAGPQLLSSIAEVCSNTPEECVKIEEKLFLLYVKMRFGKNIAVRLNEDCLYLPSETMSKHFIERLRHDIEHCNNKNILNDLSIEKPILDAVLAGRTHLSRHRVIQLARELNQNENEYLLLGDFMPDDLRILATNRGFSRLITHISTFNDSQIQKIGTIFGKIIDLMGIKGDRINKKRRG